MNDAKLLNRLAEANAHSAESPLPEMIWARDRALQEIRRRLGIETREHTEPSAHDAGTSVGREHTWNTEEVHRHPYRWSGVWVAAAVVALVLGAIGGAFLLVNRDDDGFNAAAANNIVDDYFDAFESGDVDAMIALFSPNAARTPTSFCFGTSQQCQDNFWAKTITYHERLLVYKVADGTVFENRSCEATTTSQPEVSVRCEYDELSAVVQVIDTPPATVVATFVIGPDGIGSLQRQIGLDAISEAVENVFDNWVKQEHPDDAASIESWLNSKDHARQAGVLVIQYAAEWLAFLEASGCAHDDLECLFRTMTVVGVEFS